MYKKIVNKFIDNILIILISIVIFIMWLFAKDHRIIFSVLISLFSLSSIPYLNEKCSIADKKIVSSKGKRFEARIKLVAGSILVSTALFVIFGDVLIDQFLGTDNYKRFTYSFWYYFTSTILTVLSLAGLFLFQNIIYKLAKHFKCINDKSN